MNLKSMLWSSSVPVTVSQLEPATRRQCRSRSGCGKSRRARRCRNDCRRAARAACGSRCTWRCRRPGGRHGRRVGDREGLAGGRDRDAVSRMPLPSCRCPFGPPFDQRAPRTGGVGRDRPRGGGLEPAGECRIGHRVRLEVDAERLRRRAGRRRRAAASGVREIGLRRPRDVHCERCAGVALERARVCHDVVRGVAIRRVHDADRHGRLLARGRVDDLAAPRT